MKYSPVATFQSQTPAPEPRTAACSRSSETRSACSASLRSVTSRFVPIMRSARPLASRSMTRPPLRTQRHSPLLERTRCSSVYCSALPFITASEACRTRSMSSGCVMPVSASTVVRVSCGSSPSRCDQPGLR